MNIECQLFIPMDDSKTNRIDFFSQMISLDKDFCMNTEGFWLMSKPHLPSSNNDFPDIDPFAIGSKKSFVPVLGKVLWELPNTKNATIYAYICETNNSQKIGYVRIPSYTYDEDTINIFSELVTRFEKMTSAIILDQVNNPGGSMFQMYAILSALTNKVLDLPTHELSIHDEVIDEAKEVMEMVDLGDEIPLNERPSNELISYSQFIISEAEAGRKKSKPTYLGGVTKILPAKKHYTKKVIVLINELTFSAPEFLAAILQDNNRATLFGANTAGAGGCVRRIIHPDSSLGVLSYTVTWTFATRSNGIPIENIGVQPDIKYSINVDDLQSNFISYREALLTAINDIVMTD